MDNSRLSSTYKVPNATSWMVHYVFKRISSDIPLNEIRRVFLLSLTIFFMIGGYWLFQSLKDSVITALCEVSVIPCAKIPSVLVVLGVVSGCNYLLSLPQIPKHHLFYFDSFRYFLYHCDPAAASHDGSTQRSFCPLTAIGLNLVLRHWIVREFHDIPLLEFYQFGGITRNCQELFRVRDCHRPGGEHSRLDHCFYRNGDERGDLLLLLWSSEYAPAASALSSPSESLVISSSAVAASVLSSTNWIKRFIIKY